VRNLFMSVDPYMRKRMDAGKSYVPPWEVGAALDGGAIGEVVESRAPGIVPGQRVVSWLGWRDAFVADASTVTVVDPGVSPVTAYLGVLGGTGLTAWVGLNLVDVKAGDRVFVSGAAGAVGHLAGQLAKLRGAWVVGSAGSPEKVRLLVDTLGFDAAFNYKDGDVRGQLAAAAPDGIEVYFDNVGGDHLEAAMTALHDHGRIAACGSIATYNDATPSPGPRNMFQIVAKRLTIRGFIVVDSFGQMPAYRAEASAYLQDGRLKALETVVESTLERAPQMFMDMLRGTNTGKMVVALR
jgi:NADPH-dependent curcumin reductase CurA